MLTKTALFSHDGFPYHSYHHHQNDHLVARMMPEVEFQEGKMPSCLKLGPLRTLILQVYAVKEEEKVVYIVVSH